MKLINKFISFMVFPSRKPLFETRRLWTNLSLKFVCFAITSLSLGGLYFWSWYRMDQMLRAETVTPVKRFSPDEGCVLPPVDPYSETMLRSYVEWPKVVCEGRDWVKCHMSECRVTAHVLSTMRDVVCRYKDIIHVHDHRRAVAGAVTRRGCEVYSLNASDCFKVSCTGYDKNGYGLLASRWHGYKVGIRPVTPPASPPATPPATPPDASPTNSSVNVLIVAFDSTSRGGFIFKLPKSYKVLTEELDAVLLEGYNIVGDGTAEALFPLLSGRSDLQHHPFARQRLSTTILIDPRLFIFHAAKQHGYRTAYYEDMPWIGSFQYRYNGFRAPPADHYLRSFFLEETKDGRKWYRGLSKRYCVGDTPTFRLLLDLTRQFMRVQGKRFAFTFISDISHDDFNRISTADDDLEQFLRHVKQEGYMEDTVLVVMGDHGPRFGPLRATSEGALHERLPFAAVALPRRLRRARAALAANARALCTPFDLHATLLDALALPPAPEPNRGLSLLKPIPRGRTCDDAGVTPHWCACLNAGSRAVPPADPLHRRAPAALLAFINELTEEKRAVCALRRLSSVVTVTRLAAAPGAARAVHYQTLVVTTPGPAVYQATLEFDPQTDRFAISDKDISRISSYGTEPACVAATHPHLSKYCYCVTATGRFGSLNGE